MLEKQIKSKKRVKDHGEVFTPSRIVKAMCDLIPHGTWGNIDSTFLEPSCGTGNFLVEILNRKFSLCSTPEDGLRAMRSVYGLELLPDNVEECRSRLCALYIEAFPQASHEQIKRVSRIAQANIICGDALKIMQDWSEQTP